MFDHLSELKLKIFSPDGGETLDGNHKQLGRRQAHHHPFDRRHQARVGVHPQARVGLDPQTGHPDAQAGHRVGPHDLRPDHIGSETSVPTTSSRTPSDRKVASARGQKAAATRKRNLAAQSAGDTRASVRRTVRSAESTAQAAGNATAAEGRVRLTQAQAIAERAVLVPVGASLVARDNLVSSVKVIRTKVQTRGSVERELKRYERRGATARNRFERQVRRTRTKFERELRQRRNTVEKLMSSAQDRITV